MSFTRWKGFNPDSVAKKFKNAATESSDLARPLASNLKEAARAFIESADERNELVGDRSPGENDNAL